jgi:formate dehydrogenase major subunit
MRKTVLEMILAEHPSDCFNCKKMGACSLHEYCRVHGVVKAESGLEKDLRKPDASHPFFNYDPDKCILCGKCVRTCESLQCSSVLGFAGRSGSSRIAPDYGYSFGASSCVSCGNCVAACPVGALMPRDRHFPGYSYVMKTRTICPYCGVGCSIDLLSSGGRVVGVDPADGPANRGLLCVKGRFAYSFVHSPERLTKPLVRRDGALVEASWDEALGLVVEAFLKTRDGAGPQAIAALSSARCTNEENYLFQKLYRVAGRTNNIDHCARLCHASTVTGLATTLGSGAMTDPIEGIDIQDLIFVTGSNTTETHPVIGSRMKRALARGAVLIVADPRRTELAGLAAIHLELKPGTNVALYNAMAAVIVEEGLQDEIFIGERTEGYEAWRSALGKPSVEEAAGICGVDAEAIRKAARLYAKAQRAGIYYAMGVTQHSSGTDGVKCLSNLALACGKLGKPGCGINPLRGQNNVQGACDMGCLPGDLPGYRKTGDPEARALFSRAWGVELPSERGLGSTEIFDRAAQGGIGFLHIMGENPVLSEPDSGHVAKALGKVGFLVVQDIFPTETSAFADVVLPAACFAEKDGTFTNTERRVQRVRKAVEAPGEARGDLEILAELLARLGFPQSVSTASEAGPADGSAGASAIFDEMSALIPQYRGISHARLEKRGIQWPCPDSSHPGTPILHVGRMTRGKGLFVHASWHPPREVEDADFPIVFTTGRNLYQYHTRTMTGRIDGLTRIAGEHYVEIHPETAEACGLGDGDRAVISSRRGSLETIVRARTSVKRGVAFMPFHYAEAAANLLTNGQALDPEAKIPEFKACAVRISKAARQG